MKYKLFLILSLTTFCFKIHCQDITLDTTLTNKFQDVFSVVVSDDETKMMIMVDNNKFELYSLNPVKFIKQYKVSRNTWLEHSFFEENNAILFYDYGMQLSPKFIKLNLSTGDKKRVNCSNVPRGCSYSAIKFCDSENPTLQLDKYVLKLADGLLKVYQVN